MTDETEEPPRCPKDGEPLNDDGSCALCALAENLSKNEDEEYVPAALVEAASIGQDPMDATPAASQATSGLARNRTSRSAPALQTTSSAARTSTQEPSERTPQEDREIHLAAFDRQLDQVRDRSLFTITLIGHSAAGKSFLLNRLKYQLQSAGYTSNIPVVETTKQIERTVVPTLHLINRQKDDSQFAIADVPGDYLPHFLDGDYISSAPILDAMLRSSGLVLAIPSDAAILGQSLKQFLYDNQITLEADENGQPKIASQSFQKLLSICADTAPDLTRKELKSASYKVLDLIAEHDKLLQFEHGVRGLAIAVAYLAANNLEANKERLSSANLTTAMLDANSAVAFPPLGGHTGVDMPVFVALTKADTYLPLVRKATLSDLAEKDEEWLAREGHTGLKHIINLLPNHKSDETFRQFPRELIRSHRDGFLTTVENFMPMNRFDLVTAYYGQTPDTVVDNRKPSFGVTELIEWFNVVHGLKARGDFGLTGQRLGRLDPINRRSLQRARELLSAQVGGSLRSKPMFAKASR